MGKVIEEEFPIVLLVTPPGPFQVAELLTLMVGLFLVGEVGIDFQFKLKRGLPLSEVGEINILMDAISHRTGQSKF